MFVNIDQPFRLLGVVPGYSRPLHLAQGQTMFSWDGMISKAFQKNISRFWDTEDLPSDNTFGQIRPALTFGEGLR